MSLSKHFSPSLADLLYQTPSQRSRTPFSKPTNSSIIGMMLRRQGIYDALGSLQAWAKGCILSSSHVAWHERLTQQLDRHCSLTPLPKVHAPERALEKRKQDWSYSSCQLSDSRQNEHCLSTAADAALHKVI